MERYCLPPNVTLLIQPIDQMFFELEKKLLGKLITGLKEQRIIKPLTLKNLVY